MKLCSETLQRDHKEQVLFLFFLIVILSAFEPPCSSVSDLWTRERRVGATRFEHRYQIRSRFARGTLTSIVDDRIVVRSERTRDASDATYANRGDSGGRPLLLSIYRNALAEILDDNRGKNSTRKWTICVLVCRDLDLATSVSIKSSNEEVTVLSLILETFRKQTNEHEQSKGRPRALSGNTDTWYFHRDTLQTLVSRDLKATCYVARIDCRPDGFNCDLIIGDFHGAS